MKNVIQRSRWRFDSLSLIQRERERRHDHGIPIWCMLLARWYMLEPSRTSISTHQYKVPQGKPEYGTTTLSQVYFSNNNIWFFFLKPLPTRVKNL
jgi:hypothetical protein